ncbi:MAG: integration host factor subunit beta [Alphaproteobacteria bacterium]|jgi:integration host factor subunit beta
MKKSELVSAMLEKNDTLDSDVLSKSIDIIFNEISESLVRGDRVEIRGFGAFSVLGKPERMGRNPRTGEPVQIAAKNVVHFKSGKDLKEAVN